MSRSLTRFPPATLFKYAAAGAVSIGVFSRLMSTTVHADSGARPKTFGKGPAFVSLQLESSEAVSHNTKRLRFKLPDPEAVSGLSLTCMSLSQTCKQTCEQHD